MTKCHTTIHNNTSMLSLIQIITKFQTISINLDDSGQSSSIHERCISAIISICNMQYAGALSWGCTFYSSIVAFESSHLEQMRKLQDLCISC